MNERDAEILDNLGDNGPVYYAAQVNRLALEAIGNGHAADTDLVRLRVRDWLCMDIRQLAAIRYSRRNGDAYHWHTTLSSDDDPKDALATMAFYAMLEDVNDAIDHILGHAEEEVTASD
jgi:hypothetical protein